MFKPNHITDAGAKKLANVFVRNMSEVAKVFVNGSVENVSGLAKLYPNLFLENTTLKVLNLKGNKIGEEGQKALNEVSGKNKNIEIFL